jgi:hypothetical protein
MLGSVRGVRVNRHSYRDRVAALEGEEEMDKENQHHSESSGTDQPTLETTHLQRREIQAPIAACLIRGFASVMGQDRALEVATAAVQADAMMAGKIMAEKYGGNSMKELARVVREVWAEDDAMTIHILEETGQNLSFDVTRCRYAELYEKAEMKELGYCLSCCRDEPFTKGFNPRMRLLRSQTIMQGASLCDFRFVLE